MASAFSLWLQHLLFPNLMPIHLLYHLPVISLRLCLPELVVYLRATHQVKHSLRQQHADPKSQCCTLLRVRQSSLIEFKVVPLSSSSIQMDTNLLHQVDRGLLSQTRLRSRSNLERNLLQ